LNGYLPYRIFLDSNTLQTIHEQGEAVFDGGPFWPDGHTGASPEDVEALRLIFRFNDRASFDFALSHNSLKEVDNAGDRRYLGWAYDVLDHWHAAVARPDAFEGWGHSAAVRLSQPRFGYLSREDAALVRDALALECDTFLTVERKLVTNADHLRRETGLVVLRPPEFWELLLPHLRGL
jgi:hypothetical protein